MPDVSLGLWHNFGDKSLYENMKKCATLHLIHVSHILIWQTITDRHKIKTLNEIAKARGKTLAEMSISWLLNKEAVTSVLIGASKPEQITANIKAISKCYFIDDELKKIDEAIL